MDFALGGRVAFQSVWPVLTIILNFLSKNSLLIKAVSKNEMEDIAGYGRQRLHDFDTPWCAVAHRVVTRPMRVFCVGFFWWVSWIAGPLRNQGQHDIQ